MDQIRQPHPLESARALGPALAAAAQDIEATQQFPEPLASELYAAGLFHLLLPASLGGGEVHPSDYVRTIREVARHEASVAWNLFVANSSALIAAFLPFESAKAIYDDPRASIAWGPPDAQTLESVPGGYQVSGSWGFASGSNQATWMGAHGMVREPDGELRLNAAGKPLIRTVLFPKEEAELLGDWNPIGLRGTGSQSYKVTGAFVPEAFSSTREEPENRRETGPLYAFTQQGLYAIGVAAVSLGVAGAMLESFRELAEEKAPRGRPRLADDALVQADYARADAKLGSALAYLTTTLDDIYDRASGIPAIGTADRARVRLASSTAIQAGVEVGDWTHRAAGVSAIFPGSPFERRFRDLHTVSQQIQSRSSHFEAVGQVLLGVPPPVFY